MRIPFAVEGKEYLLVSDTQYYSYDVVTEKIHKNKDGEDVAHRKLKGSFLTLFGAINYILDLKIKKSSVSTLTELREVILQAKKELQEIYDFTIEK